MRLSQHSHDAFMNIAFVVIGYDTNAHSWSRHTLSLNNHRRTSVRESSPITIPNIAVRNTTAPIHPKISDMCIPLGKAFDPASSTISITKATGKVSRNDQRQVSIGRKNRWITGAQNNKNNRFAIKNTCPAPTAPQCFAAKTSAGTSVANKIKLAMTWSLNRPLANCSINGSTRIPTTAFARPYQKSTGAAAVATTGLPLQINKIGSAKKARPPPSDTNPTTTNWLTKR